MSSEVSLPDCASELSALLYGLRYRGLAVGPDDAARLATVFQHAADWSHQRRVRVLKSLLARSDEERLLIEQLAPFLFVHAHKQSHSADAAPQQKLAREDSQHEQSGRVFARVEIPSEGRQDSQTTVLRKPNRSAKDWLAKHWVWLMVVAGVVLSLAVWQPWLLSSMPSPPDTGTGISERPTVAPELAPHGLGQRTPTLRFFTPFRMTRT